MANIKQGNSHYIDSTGDLVTTPVKIRRILITATGANANVVLSDPNGTTRKFDIRVATSGTTGNFQIDTYFPNGVEVTTLTNAIATIVYGES